MYRTEKGEGLELFMERQLWPIAGASDLLSLATGMGDQEWELLTASILVFTRLWGPKLEHLASC